MSPVKKRKHKRILCFGLYIHCSVYVTEGWLFDNARWYISEQEVSCLSRANERHWFWFFRKEFLPCHKFDKSETGTQMSVMKMKDSQWHWISVIKDSQRFVWFGTRSFYSVTQLHRIVNLFHAVINVAIIVVDSHLHDLHNIAIKPTIVEVLYKTVHI